MVCRKRGRCNDDAHGFLARTTHFIRTKTVLKFCAGMVQKFVAAVIFKCATLFTIAT